MASAVAGGALRGLGAALVKRSDNEREDKLRAEDRAQRNEEQMRDRAHQSARQIADNLFGAEQNRLEIEARGAEGKADRDARAAEPFDVIQAETGDDRVLTRGGDTRGIGFRSQRTSSGGGGSGEDQGPISASDQRLINSIKDRHTSTGEGGDEVTNWRAVENALREQGRDDLADMMKDAPESAAPPIDSPELDEVADRVGDVRSERDSLKQRGAQSPELDEYLDTADRTLQRTGRGQRSNAAPDAGASGQGTEQNPHKPSTQEEFNALPSGAIYLNPADGKLYRKN